MNGLQDQIDDLKEQLAAARKLRLDASIRLRAYDIVTDAVDRAVSYGWTRAHKHTDEPDEDTIRDCIFEAVTSALCEIIDFNLQETRDDQAD